MEVADYKTGDELEILKLFKTSFKKELSLNFWNWRFLNNPAGDVMIKLMWDGNTLAGHYAVSPVELIINGEVQLSALSMTTMTHPEYGGRGIFTTLAESLYSDIKDKHNVSSVWGFPNNNSHYGFIKNLKWKDLNVIPTLSISLNNFNKRRDERINVTKNFRDEHSDAFHSTLLGKNKVAVHRTKQYLNWRYSNNPVNNYTIFECNDRGDHFYAVTKCFAFNSENGKEDLAIDLVEICFPADINLLYGLISEIVAFYYSDLNTNLSRINLWLPLSDPKFILFEKIGFSIHSPLTYMGARSLSPAGNPTEQFQKWYYSMGDSDIY
jgi:hypothetical protein